MAEEIPDSPGPGNYSFTAPYGWEDDSDDAQMNAYLGYTEDPILKAMRLEAEAEQDCEWEKNRGPARERAKWMKKQFRARRKINFDAARKYSAQSISSYDTDDFMSEPSISIHELHGEKAWMDAFKVKAQQKKKLRKLIAGSNAPPSPVKTPSPKKIAQAYAKQTPAVQQAIAQVLVSTPKKFGDINLDSSDDEVPLPATRFASAGKKKFFSSPVKSSSPCKVKPAVVKKSFFADPVLDSDSDSDFEIPGLKKIPSPTKKFSIAKKSFFSDPSASPKKVSQGHATITEFCMAALETKLNDRKKELARIKTGEKVYSPCPFLPDIVTAFLYSNKGSDGFNEFAIKIEELVIEAMVNNLEKGKTKCDPHKVLQEAQQKLRNDSKQLDAILATIDNQ